MLEETYATHVITHVCLESHGAVCEWDGDRLTAWVSTQGVSASREGFANGLEAFLRRTCASSTEHMGGGFGSKLAPDPQAHHLRAAGARRRRRPSS